MPLAPSTLESELLDLFAHPPATRAACAQSWADAMAAYATGIVPPSTTVAAAATALAGALATAFAAPSAVAGMESAFAAFASAVGLGMAGYTPVPPPLPVGFAVQFAGPKPATHAAAADQLATLIHSWLTTGVSTLIAPPFTVVTWS
jgi:hypothetical protein